MIYTSYASGSEVMIRWHQLKHEKVNMPGAKQSPVSETAGSSPE